MRSERLSGARCGVVSRPRGVVHVSRVGFVAECVAAPRVLGECVVGVVVWGVG